MPVALIDIMAGHQLKEAILMALLNRSKTDSGSHVTVSLFDSAVASLANQATNWLIAHHLPKSQGSLHPNIAPYGEIFTTQDQHQITFAIGSDKQFKHLCDLLDLKLDKQTDYSTNQFRVTNRKALFEILNKKIQLFDFDFLFKACLEKDIPIGKIRNLEEVFKLPEAKQLLRSFDNKGTLLNSVSSIGFKFH